MISSNWRCLSCGSDFVFISVDGDYVCIACGDVIANPQRRIIQVHRNDAAKLPRKFSHAAKPTNYSTLSRGD